MSVRLQRTWRTPTCPGMATDSPSPSTSPQVWCWADVLDHNPCASVKYLCSGHMHCCCPPAADTDVRGLDYCVHATLLFRGRAVNTAQFELCKEMRCPIPSGSHTLDFSVDREGRSVVRPMNS